MRRPVPLSARHSPRRAGFALAAVLLTVSLLLIVLVVFSGVVGVENTSSGNAEFNAHARQNAITAMNLALGELQKEMGPDQRVSATAEMMGGALANAAFTNNAAWTGVWKATNWDGSSVPDYTTGKANVFQEWLVSMPTNQVSTNTLLPATALAIATNTVALVGAGTCGVSNKVVVYKIAGEQQGTNGPQNAYAWWVGDEGVKARINLPILPKGAAATSDGARMAALLTSPGANPMAVTNFAGTAATGVTNQDTLLRKALTYGELALAYGGTSLTNNFFDFTPYSQGVLSDTQHGGLKQDLSLLLEQPSAFTLNASKAATTATDFPQASPVTGDPVFSLGLNNNTASPSYSGYPWLYVYNAATYLGTDWGYLHRYYNVYKKIFRASDGVYTLNFDNYNAGLGNASTPDPLYTPGSNPASPATDTGGPYTADTVVGVGGMIYQWNNGTVPGRADFVVPLMLRLQVVVGMYKGSLDYLNVGKQGTLTSTGGPTQPWPTAHPNVYYLAYFPVAHLWNPYNVRIKTQSAKGNTTGLVWHTPCPPVRINLDGNAISTGTDGWIQIGFPDANKGSNSVFWPSAGQLGDLITGYGKTYTSSPIILEPGAVGLYGPLPSKQAGALAGAGGLFSGDNTLSSSGVPSRQPSSQDPYDLNGAPCPTNIMMTNAPSAVKNSGNRTYNMATTSPGWPTSPLSPMISHSLGGAMMTASGWYTPGTIATLTAPATYTYKDYISSDAVSTLKVQAQFDFSQFSAPNTPLNLGNSLLGGGYNSSSAAHCVLVTNYEVDNTLGAAKTVDANAYPSLPPGTTSALTVTASTVPAFPDNADFSGAGVNIQPVYLFMINLSRKVYPFDVQGSVRFGLFNDPLSRVYLTGGAGRTAAEMSPYEYSLKYLQPTGLGAPIIYDKAPGATDDGTDAIYGGALGQSGFGSGGATLYNVAAELPIAPMLSLAQIQNVPLGRDYGNPENAVCDPNTGGRASDNNLGTKTATTYAATFNHAFANSYAHPMIPANALNDGGRSFDHSFYANNALWDRYFFSGIAPQDSAAFCSYNGSTANPRTAYSVLSDFISGASSLPDPRYSFYLPGGHASSEIQSVLLPKATAGGFGSVNAEGICVGDAYSGTTTQAITGTTVTPYSQTSTYLMNQGAFNVNSVSAAAWTALLSGLQSPVLAGLNVPYTQTSVGGSPPSGSLKLTSSATSSSSQFFPFLRFMLPNNTGTLASSGATQNYWNGYHELNSAQIKTLAQNIVAEVKKRGPFLSMAEFVNRQVSSNAALNAAGALQSAIDGPAATSFDSSLSDPKINTLTPSDTVAGATAYPNNTAANGSRLSGTPAYLTQADLLTPLANVIAVRSDTFVIRSYGEITVGGKIQARAWCEAVVQRVPDYVVNKLKASDNGDAPSVYPPTNATNLQFGRKFKVIQFRWLAPNEV